MEVHFTPDAEKKLNDIASQSGGGTADKLVQDVVGAYFEELEHTRETLNSRYDDLKSGTLTPIPGDEIEAWFREKSLAARRLQPGALPDTRCIRRRAATSTKFGNTFARIVSMPPTA
jgi:hypothetical protein